MATPDRRKRASALLWSCTFASELVFSRLLCWIVVDTSCDLLKELAVLYKQPCRRLGSEEVAGEPCAGCWSASTIHTHINKRPG